MEWTINLQHTSFSDSGVITLLYQDDMGGLEVRGVNNSWVPAPPIEGAVLINAGDFLEMYTNGRLPATLHRVVIPEEEVKRKCTRQSIVFFVHPNNETLISPLPNFLEADDHRADLSKNRAGTKTKEFTKGYQPVTSKEHVIRRFAATYQY